jgi:exopolyphosphatase/guanosine-5'-triphosphate,3'-diphosphate pyrophosphatase
MSHPAQRSSADRVSEPDLTLAAVDLGTNNCRLLIARPAGCGFAIVDSFSRIVRLGEGVAHSGRLAERAMDRTIAALRVCARLISKHRVTRARCVATEACRRAANGRQFIERVRRATRLEFDLLSHHEEACLALLGCLGLIDGDADHVLLVDIGGGSTELVWLEPRPAAAAGQLRCVASVPAGVVTLTEAFGDDPDDATFAAMVAEVRRLLDPIEAAHGLGAAMRGRRLQLLGTSGTVTTLAAVLLDLPRYDRSRVDGLAMAPASLGGIAARLRAMRRTERAAHPCIGAGRADLVIAGCAILEAVLGRWPADTLRVADRGLREGVLHGLMGRTLESALRIGALPAATAPAGG